MNIDALSSEGATQLSSNLAFDSRILRYEHESKTLGQLKAKFSLIVPPGDTVVGTLVWLSGLTCTDENFIIKAGAARLAKTYNMVIACPDTSPRGANAPDEDKDWDFGTGAGFYVDATEKGYENYQMSSYVTQELIPLLARVVGTDKMAISGHSMGGMGALQLALNSPQLFYSVSAFAPICHPSVVPWGQKCFSKYLGDNNDDHQWSRYDPVELLGRLNKPSKFASILVHQGKNDQFLTSQLRIEDLIDVCQRIGQPLSAKIEDGYDHSYFFVQTFLEEHVTFHHKALTEGDVRNVSLQW